jgi:hypothetical protein
LDGHVFYLQLKGKSFDLRDFTISLASLSGDILGEIASAIPEPWLSPSVGKISAHLQTMRDRAGVR